MNTQAPDAQSLKKQRVAQAAIQHLSDGMILGVGTGSTVNAFIDQLGPWARRLAGAVSSSDASTTKLRTLGIPIVDLNAVDGLSLYIDGADEANDRLELIKGGGAALTREKIVAACAERFICIVDESKLVPYLGAFPLPVEVIPMARSFVARQLVKMGGEPELRENFTTDNGNPILDIHNLEILNPIEMEDRINAIPGVVTAGLFARRPADTLIVAAAGGVETRTR